MLKVDWWSDAWFYKDITYKFIITSLINFLLLAAESDKFPPLNFPLKILFVQTSTSCYFTKLAAASPSPRKNVLIEYVVFPLSRTTFLFLIFTYVLYYLNQQVSVINIYQVETHKPPQENINEWRVFIRNIRQSSSYMLFWS